MEIIFATRNKGKLKEVKEILKDHIVFGMEEIGIDIEVIEDGNTFEENALKKAVEIMKAAGKVVLSDDSGMEIDCLNKEPGVQSAYFLGEHTPYAERNAIILDMLKDVRDNERGARYVAVIAAAFPDGRTLLSKGIMEGYIGYEQRGENGFGYDSIFYPKGYDKSVAELSSEAKNGISHRGIALREMEGLLREMNT
ncbi:MAG: RdgB/HAM1 family non-canonical purine NTP pyrophosphatase [Defluviitaleaceae bacterium]|nr:RdgB/HAM1 family non-canonical purine NTP pyrophosphatase [Defluviitaleaceae bacterium]